MPSTTLRYAAVRVVDIERDMRDVIPTGVTPDSSFLFERMTALSLALARPRPGRRILDVASGMGQDARLLSARGARVVGLEPSLRMARFAKQENGDAGNGRAPRWVRGWASELPFAAGSFDAAICKGALDHFDHPEAAIAEMARVTAGGGRVVLAIANFDSLSCRIGRSFDDLRESWLRVPPPPGRRVYDVPTDHYTRYDAGLVREQASRHLELEVVRGVSLGWGVRGWSALAAALPARAAGAGLRTLDRVARRLPALADVVIVAGRSRRTRPARSAITSPYTSTVRSATRLHE